MQAMYDLPHGYDDRLASDSRDIPALFGESDFERFGQLTRTHNMYGIY